MWCFIIIILLALCLLFLLINANNEGYDNTYKNPYYSYRPYFQGPLVTSRPKLDIPPYPPKAMSDVDEARKMARKMCYRGPLKPLFKKLGQYPYNYKPYSHPEVFDRYIPYDLEYNYPY
jgi:hypothetical protein